MKSKNRASIDAPMGLAKQHAAPLTQQERQTLATLRANPKHWRSRDFRERVACGAWSRSSGKPCAQPALGNGRCKYHGGMSSGPRTAAGKRKVAANLSGQRCQNENK
jgi:hypothetical protein